MPPGCSTRAPRGLPTETVDHRRFERREEFDRYLSDMLEANDIRLVCLAGFMRVLSGWFAERWRDRMLNIHPSLLPAFPGLDTHRRALAAGVRFSGCTVHFVRAEVDAGPIIVQGVVPVRRGHAPRRSPRASCKPSTAAILWRWIWSRPGARTWWTSAC